MSMNNWFVLLGVAPVVTTVLFLLLEVDDEDWDRFFLLLEVDLDEVLPLDKDFERRLRDDDSIDEDKFLELSLDDLDFVRLVDPDGLDIDNDDALSLETLDFLSNILNIGFLCHAPSSMCGGPWTLITLEQINFSMARKHSLLGRNSKTDDQIFPMSENLGAHQMISL